MLVLLSAAIAPGLALLCYFYLNDKNETEPLSMVLRSFLNGALLVFPLMFMEYIMEEEQIIENMYLSSFLTVAFIEEFFKWFILFFTIYNHVEFDEPYDGIVYGVAVSLGFATLENILYLFANGVHIAMGRALLPVSSHALFGVIMGYYLGKGKFSLSNAGPYLFLAFFIPFILHGLYNLILLKGGVTIYWMLPFMVFLWWLGMNKVKKARMV
ncbi:glutamic-type intramembrane protease PrsW [Peribacillus frigoritolerans]|uniref:glutamic-type intramembrane protease PrsW n=1 Tax=Peribacillus frigoritolerans TaxID=450367 RepID=UPI002EC62AD4|nr:glutamic-type intramembrane protease PrsW [Peribacillus frigoritolerans]